MPFKFLNPFREQISTKPKIKVIETPLTDEHDEINLTANNFYFEIRLCELYLRVSAEGGVSYVPRSLAITECNYGNGQEMVLPVAVGEHILSEVASRTGDDPSSFGFTFKNCPLAGPMPYRGGDIGLFNGLYRVESGNFADSVFDLVSDITGNLGLDISKYLNIGRQVTQRLPALLGADTGDWRIGHYAPIYTEGDRFFNRYLILLGKEGVDFDLDSLEVCHQEANETLNIKTSNGHQPFNSRDYMLIKLKCRKERGDYAKFPFHKRFDEVKNYLISQDFAKAEWAMTEQMQEIASCPDLTEHSQRGLTLMYRGKLEQWKDIYNPPKNDATNNLRGASRSTQNHYRGSAASGGDALGSGRAMVTAQNKGLPKATLKTLKNISLEWKGLRQQLDGWDVEDFSDQAVNSFIQTVADKDIVGVPTGDLVDAVKVYNLSRN